MMNKEKQESNNNNNNNKNKQANKQTHVVVLFVVCEEIRRVLN